MKRIILLLFLFSGIFAQNAYPIVLIHGFMGWGEDEMGGYRYWGGRQDYAQMLRDEGHTVFTVSVGPVSSNWERAVEVYTHLKGGQVDYGKAHAKKYNIVQKPDGKIYEALYPEWDETHPVHLFGHSMGGQTARMLQYLLTQAISTNEEIGELEISSLLGQSKNGWVRSITTLSTPHNGTSMSDVVIKIIPFIQYFVGVAGVVGTQFYDFNLEQWGFSRIDGESWSTYVKRMRTHTAWDTKNISSWDLSISGAQEMNGYCQADPDVYYFSITCSTTKKKENSPYHEPVEGTSILTKTRSKILGSRSGYWPDGSPTDSTWFENDGLVNTISMAGPTTGANGPDPIAAYDETELLIPGQWYTQGPFVIDHWNIVGHLGDEKSNIISVGIFLDQANRLKRLPAF